MTGYHYCERGRRWGEHGAAGVLLVHDGAVYLTLRGSWVSYPGTWAFPGGAVDAGESPYDAAVREAHEEVGLELDGSERLVAEVVARPCPCWEYRTFVLEVATRDVFDGHALEETDDEAWVDVEELAGVALHPAVQAALPALLDLLRKPGDETGRYPSRADTGAFQ